jgi:NAD-dependent deacetylase
MTAINDPALIEAFRGAGHVVVLTGAGVSAESGIATFRDALTGLWSRFNAEDLATPEAFDRDPELVSRWYDERRCKTMACEPNGGHVALARLQAGMEAAGRKFTLITQNVDRLHQRAGSRDVLELHGTLHVWRCVGCGEAKLESGPAFTEFPPKCSCGGNRRPGVVWFGENLDGGVLNAAADAAQRADLFLTLGTSSVVHPAAGLIDVALGAKAKVVEVNLQPTAYSKRVTWSLRAKTGEVLPWLVDKALAG